MGVWLWKGDPDGPPVRRIDRVEFGIKVCQISSCINIHDVWTCLPAVAYEGNVSGLSGVTDMQAGRLPVDHDGRAAQGGGIANGLVSW